MRATSVTPLPLNIGDEKLRLFDFERDLLTGERTALARRNRGRAALPLSCTCSQREHEYADNPNSHYTFHLQFSFN
jgi:hypothetical protein